MSSPLASPVAAPQLCDGSGELVVHVADAAVGDGHHVRGLLHVLLHRLCHAVLNRVELLLGCAGGV